MGRKKGKRRKKTNRPSPAFFIVLFCSSLACAALISLYVYFSGGSAKTSPLIYEEIYSSTYLGKSIRKVDYALFESLYRGGIKKNDISFLKVQPRSGNGQIWDFTEIAIRCPDDKSALNVSGILARELAELAPEIGIKKEQTSESRIISHVFIGDFYTHKIVLNYDNQIAAPKVLRPKVAFIIDDLGYDPTLGISFIRSYVPLSVSVLPHAPYSKSIAGEAGRAGRNVLLHLPMEPKNYPDVDPGPGALLLSMDAEEIVKALDGDLKEIPNVRGVNNHMGSSFTASREKMRLLLEELKKRDLFYVDSRTTAGTVAFSLAKEIGVPTARRNVFLDNDLNVRAIEMQVERLLFMAKDRGSAVGIGHPHPEMLEVLEAYYPRMKDEFEIVPVSNLLR